MSSSEGFADFQEASWAGDWDDDFPSAVSPAASPATPAPTTTPPDAAAPPHVLLQRSDDPVASKAFEAKHTSPHASPDALGVCTPTPKEGAAAAVPSSPSPDAREQEDAREEYERQRAARLERLERLEREKAKRRPQEDAASGSWGGWLSSASLDMGSWGAMELSMQHLSVERLHESAQKLRREASERAESVFKAAALQSPMSELRAKLHGAAPTPPPAAPRGEAAEGGGAAAGSPEAPAADAASLFAMPSLGKGLSEGLSRGILPSGSLSSAAALLPKPWSGLSAMQWSRLSGSSDGAQAEPKQTGGEVAEAAAEAEDASPAAAEAPRPLTEAEQLERLLAEGSYDKAASWAANSPKQELRVVQTIQRFQSLPPPAAGGQPPILLYFGALLRRKGPLRTCEGLELARGVCAQGQAALVSKWVAEGKVERSEALADIVRTADPAAAAPIYKSVGCARAEMRCHAELSNIDEVVHLCNSMQPPCKPDWARLLAEICALPGGAPRAIALEEALRALPPPPPPPDPTDSLAVMTYNMDMRHTPPPPPPEDETVRIFLEHGCLRHATKLALDALASLDGGELIDGALQTRLLLENLSADKQIGEALLEANSFPDLDKQQVAAKCEALHLLPHALRLYSSAEDIGRVLSSPAIGDEACCRRVAELPPADGLRVVKALLRCASPQTLAKVLYMGRALADSLGHEQLVRAFEEVGHDVGLQCYLAARMDARPSDAALTLEYLRVAKRLGKPDEVERITGDPTKTYDPRAVLDMLQEPMPNGSAWPFDARPVINICDRFDLPEEMTRKLHEHGKHGHLKLYIQKVNPTKAPQVVAALLGVGYDPQRLRDMLAPIGAKAFAEDPTFIPRLIRAFEERDLLATLQPWLQVQVETLEQGPNFDAAQAALQKLKPKGLWSLLG